MRWDSDCLGLIATAMCVCDCVNSKEVMTYTSYYYVEKNLLSSFIFTFCCLEIYIRLENLKYNTSSFYATAAAKIFTENKSQKSPKVFIS